MTGATNTLRSERFNDVAHKLYPEKRSAMAETMCDAFMANTSWSKFKIKSRVCDTGVTLSRHREHRAQTCGVVPWSSIMPPLWRVRYPASDKRVAVRNRDQIECRSDLERYAR